MDQQESRTLKLTNRRGLHARAAAQFVDTVHKFNAPVSVIKGRKSVSGDSIMELMMMLASYGDAIEIKAEGPQSSQVLNALETLITNKFGEEGCKV